MLWAFTIALLIAACCAADVPVLIPANSYNDDDIGAQIDSYLDLLSLCAKIHCRVAAPLIIGNQLTGATEIGGERLSNYLAIKNAGPEMLSDPISLATVNARLYFIFDNVVPDDHCATGICQCEKVPIIAADGNKPSYCLYGAFVDLGDFSRFIIAHRTIAVYDWRGIWKSANETSATRWATQDLDVESWVNERPSINFAPDFLRRVARESFDRNKGHRNKIYINLRSESVLLDSGLNPYLFAHRSSALQCLHAFKSITMSILMQEGSAADVLVSSDMSNTMTEGSGLFAKSLGLEGRELDTDFLSLATNKPPCNGTSASCKIRLEAEMALANLVITFGQSSSRKMAVILFPTDPWCSQEIDGKWCPLGDGAGGLAAATQLMGWQQRVVEESSCAGIEKHASAWVRGHHMNLFEQLPEAFLVNYKSPCWVRGGALFCLPALYILGPMKTASTYLFSTLTNLADPTFDYAFFANDNKSKTDKEPYFWNQEVENHCFKGTMGKYCNFSQYVISWAGEATDHIKRNPDLDLVDGTAIAFTGGPSPFKGLPTLAQLLFEATPSARMIVTVRNPADRAKSNFFYPTKSIKNKSELQKALANQYSDVAFLEAVKANLFWMRKCLNLTSTAYCAYHGSPSALQAFESCLRKDGTVSHCRTQRNSAPGILGHGMYWPFLLVWLHSFPPDQLLVIGDTDRVSSMSLLESKDNGNTTLGCIIKFSGHHGPYFPDNSHSISSNSNPISLRQSEHRALAMAEMESFFAPHNKRLWDITVKFGVPRCL